MKIFKNIIMFVLGISMVLGISINTYAEGFSDLPRTHWAHESVQWGVGKGLVVGYEDGTYKPALQITEEEFVTVLARYTNLTVQKKDYWSQGYYDALEQYKLPLKGTNDMKEKKTGLSRGRIAQLIAAKNGFNLDERQAIYYMYENDISNGLIDGVKSFESYGRGDAVTRAQIPAFFQRLEEKGHTTFMGKPSPVKDGNGIGGINGVPKDNTVITDDDFKKLEKDTSEDDFEKLPMGDFSEFESVAKKHGLRLDGGRTGFSLRDDSNKVNPIKISYTDSGGGNFDISMKNYTANKGLLGDLLKQTGKFTDSDIKEVYNTVENKHGKILFPDNYNISDKIYVYTSGRIDGSNSGGLQMYFGFR